MSERKQVIHVKDLVIKADNVYVERGRRREHDHHQHLDPFFGSERNEEESERRESSNDHQHTQEFESGEQDEERRRPFDWF